VSHGQTVTIVTTPDRARSIRLALMERANGVRPWARLAAEEDARGAPALLAFLMATISDVDDALVAAERSAEAAAPTEVAS
jgi:hypothetical protein